MIIIRKGQWTEQTTKIYPITIDYLKEVQKYFLDTDLLNSISSFTNKINTLKSDELYDKYLNIINNITFYVDGVDSSAIENIISDESYHSEENKNKIASYNQQVYFMRNNEIKMNNESITKFHDAIEPKRKQGIRDDFTPQWIGEHKAPDGKDILSALDNFWKIYQGSEEYDEINIFIRWAYQHILFESIHPFDDGNGRTGRMLNLFFFDNQASNIFENLFIGTSHSIFNSKEMYQSVLKHSRVYVNSISHIYNSDIRKSISRDITACEYLLTRLHDSLVNFLQGYDKTRSIIKELYDLLLDNKILKRYTNTLIDFFSKNVVFDRVTLRTETKLSDTTISKLFKELLNLNLIETKNITKIRNCQKYIFLPFKRIIQ